MGGNVKRVRKERRGGTDVERYERGGGAVERGRNIGMKKGWEDKGRREGTK